MRNLFNIKRVIIALMLAGLLVISMSGCSEEKENNVEQPAKETYSSKAAKIYGKVLDNIDEYDFGDEEFLSDEYNYALVNLDRGNLPQLLVEKIGMDGEMSAVGIFTCDKNLEKEIFIKEILSMGDAPSGGFRCNLLQYKNGYGILESTASSVTGTIADNKITLVNNKLQRALIWEGNIDKMPEYDEQIVSIKWTDIDDRKIIDELSRR